jgi:polyphosphate kinase 2
MERTGNPAPNPTDSSAPVLDVETRDDVGLISEGAALDALANGPERIKPHGRDADHPIKPRHEHRLIDDRAGPLRRLDLRPYIHLITPLHVELLKLQNHVKAQKLKVVLIFEGRDAAGKGGTIKRFIEHMNPRGARVVALDKPTDGERTQWYFQRYVRHLPSGGEIVFFDRSWYNRAMVERVMGFCHDNEVREFLRSAPEFERMLIRAGVHLFKFYFSVSKEEQARRFGSRIDDPLKQWKLSPVDLESQNRWDAYTKAKEDMFFYTSTADAPWVIIKSDDKKRARLNAIRHFLSGFDYPDKRTDLLAVDRRIVRSVGEELHVED